MASLVTNGAIFTPSSEKDTAKIVAHGGGQLSHIPVDQLLKTMKPTSSSQDIMLVPEGGGQPQPFSCAKVEIAPSDRKQSPCVELSKKWHGTIIGGSGQPVMCLVHVWTNAQEECIASFVPGGSNFTKRVDGTPIVSPHDHQIIHMLLDEAIKKPRLPYSDIVLKNPEGKMQPVTCADLLVAPSVQI